MVNEFITIHLDKTTSDNISVQIDDHKLNRTVILDNCYSTLKDALKGLLEYYDKK